MKTYQIILQSKEDIDGIDFLSQDGQRAEVLSIVDITEIFKKELIDFAKDLNMSEEIGEA